MQLLDSVTPLSKFAPHILANTLGDETQGSLPENVAISFLRNSAISFAERTGVLKRNVKIDLQCGVSEYPIEHLTCETIISIQDAKLGNFNETEFTNNCWSWGGIDFTLYDGVVKVSPCPTTDKVNGLELTLIVAPTRDACEVNSILYNKWFNAIIAGALSQIHMMVNQPWSSVNRSRDRQSEFNEDVGRATIRDVLEETNRPITMVPNPNWVNVYNSQSRW